MHMANCTILLFLVYHSHLHIWIKTLFNKDILLLDWKVGQQTFMKRTATNTGNNGLELKTTLNCDLCVWERLFVCVCGSVCQCTFIFFAQRVVYMHGDFSPIFFPSSFYFVNYVFQLWVCVHRFMLTSSECSYVVVSQG